MLVGNDIVDLGEPENQPDAIHPRFDERVFTPAERERIAERARLTGQAAAHRLRWRMWAAKESAFKVARKLDEAVRFLPRRFSVHFTGDARAVVRHVDGPHVARRFEVTFAAADEWIHAIASRVDRDGLSRGISAVVERIEPGRSKACDKACDASARVRRIARDALGSVLSIAPSEIEIGTAERIPVALWRESSLPVDLSLSHHGRFLACAWSRPGR